MIARDYQRAAVAAARDKTASDGNTLLMLPVGSGKTCIAGFYIGEEAAADSVSRFLVVQHTDELIEQNRRTIGHITELPTSIVKAERDDWLGRVVFGSIQTLGRATRRERMTAVSHLVIDECHRAAADSYQALIGHARSLTPEVKRHVTGKGNADKAAMIAAVKALGFGPADDNEADALALLNWAIAHDVGVIP